MGCRIAEIQERDRPRERLGRLGTESLTDAELVALVIRSGGPGVSALGLAERLLGESGGVGGLATQRLEGLAGIQAMGTAKASSLVAAFELGRRAAAGSEATAFTIRDPGDIAGVARRELTDGGREGVVVLVLNSAHRVIRTQRLTVGTDTRCLLEPRDVLRVVIGNGGTAFAVAHNHPAGNTQPSPEDVARTRSLKAAAESVGLRFLDHVIVTRRGWRSVSSD